MIFQYTYMQRAFAVGILVAIITPMIGMIVVTKRLSMIGDALSHSSLAGVAAGLLFGVNPVIGAAMACVASALCIEAMRKRITKFSEMSVAIIMSAGIGLAGVLSGYVKSPMSFNSFFFGSFVSIDREEVWFAVAVAALVLSCFFLFYRQFFYVVFDERAARLSGVKVGVVNFLITMLTAVTVSAAARVVGALIVSSLMVIPVACSMQLGKSFKATMAISVLFSLAFTLAGLFLSFYVSGLKTGGAIALVGVLCFAAIFAFRKFAEKIKIQIR